MRNYKIKVCLICGKEFLPTGCRQKWCVGCVKLGQKLAAKAWKVAHHEQYLSVKKEWTRSHPEKVTEMNRKYLLSHPQVIKSNRHKQKAHHRTLGFMPLNEPFIGCESHHIDRKYVVYAPRELHQSIRHNVWNGKNMKEINDKVFAWLSSQVAPFPSELPCIQRA